MRREVETENSESHTMQTMIDLAVPESANTTAPQAETGPISDTRERGVGWLIVAATVMLLFLAFKLVMLELEVQVLLDDLHAVAGQSLLPNS
jgi:hypothetical protein